MYIIWNQHIWSLYYPELGWRKMANRGSVTANHKNHVHISLSWDGAMKQTSWWTGVPVTQPLNSRCGVNGARPACRRSDGGRRPGRCCRRPCRPPSCRRPGPSRTWAGARRSVGRSPPCPGTWVPADATLTYQWLAGSKDIAGAVAATYVVGAGDRRQGDLGPRHSDVALGHVDEDHRRHDGRAEGALHQHAEADDRRHRRPPTRRSRPIRAPGQPCRTASPTCGSGTGRPSRAPRLRRYQVTPADVAKKLSVTVTGRKAGYGTVSVTSASTTVAKAGFTTVGVPTVDG